MSNYSSVIGQILENIKQEAEPPQPKPKPPPKDFSRANIQRIRELQTSSAQSTSPSSSQAPRSNKYAQVSSRFMSSLNNQKSSETDRSSLATSPQEGQPGNVATKYQNYGKVPSYLLARKQQWKAEEEERKRNAPNPSIPPGHSLMSEEERVETLALLKKNQEEILQKLASLPLTHHTLRQKKLKEELEARLAKVDEGIDIFSRSKVLIKNDEES